MSYTGTTISEGPFLQGLTSSDLQDTWTSRLISYSSTNKVATLETGLSGDWRLAPSFTSPGSTGRYESRMPNSAASTYALHGNLVTWDTGSRFGGDESLVNPDAASCGYYLHGTTGGGTLTIDVSHCSTICELLP